MPAVAHLKDLADYLVEPAVREELFDGQFADGNDQLWFENIDFAFEPGSAVFDFVPGGNAVATGFFLARKTTADRSHVNTILKLFFGQMRRVMKPFEERSARGPREGAHQN